MWSLFEEKKKWNIKTDWIYVKNNIELKGAWSWNLKFSEDAVNLAIEKLKIFNFKNINENNTEIDLEWNIKIFIEVEHDYATREKRKDSFSFPYDKINIPKEKEKHFLKYRFNSFYLKFSENLKSCLVLYWEDILNNSEKEILKSNHSWQYANREFIRINRRFWWFFDIDKPKNIILFIVDKIYENHKI